jgi:multidrug transporter EmrE-like cation transporter
MVLVLVLLPGLAGMFHDAASGPDAGEIVRTVAIMLGKFGVFVAVMLLVGKKLIPTILHYVAHTGSRELFRLAVLSIALGVAYAAAELFGVSLALGAFFAGMMLSESRLSQQAATESLPLRDAFAVLLFVSVGVLFNPHIVVAAPLALLATVLIILVEIDRRLSRRAFLRPLARDRADDVRLARSDRRVLLHPRQSRLDPRAPSCGRPRSHSRRRHHHHSAQSASLRYPRFIRGKTGEGARRGSVRGC